MAETTIKEKKVLQGNSYGRDAMKILAMTTMLIDHIGYIFFPGEVIYRSIGRLAFPIFAYQIAMGYNKTSNLKKYLQRLFIFALISQLSYFFFNPNLRFYPLHFNVLFMYIAAIVIVYVYDSGISKFRSFIENKSFINLIYSISLFILALILIILPEVIGFYVKDFSFEYGLLGLVMVLFFHIFRDNSKGAVTAVILLYLFHGYYWAALYNSGGNLESFFSNLINIKFIWDKINYNNGLIGLTGYYFGARGAFALIPIYMLKRKNTSNFRINKYIAYAFYPAHITLLIIIKVILYMS